VKIPVDLSRYILAFPFPTSRKLALSTVARFFVGRWWLGAQLIEPDVVGDKPRSRYPRYRRKLEVVKLRPASLFSGDLTPDNVLEAYLSLSTCQQYTEA
jgi:hypothetical protein